MPWTTPPSTICTIAVSGLTRIRSAAPMGCCRRCRFLVPYAASNFGTPRTVWRITYGTITPKVGSAWRTVTRPSRRAIPPPSDAREV